jgi:hypothetical protein
VARDSSSNSLISRVTTSANSTRQLSGHSAGSTIDQLADTSSGFFLRNGSGVMQRLHCGGRACENSRSMIANNVSIETALRAMAFQTFLDRASRAAHAAAIGAR